MNINTNIHNYNYNTNNDDVYCVALIVYNIYTSYQEWKMRRRIKKYLKIVVEFSNLIQDEKNILQDMKKANFNQQDIRTYTDYVLRLILKQRNAIKDLVNVEKQYPGEIHNRFFYFKDKNIF